MFFHVVDLKKYPLRYKLQEFQVFFSDEKCFDAICSILNETGEILNFPGVIEDERWTKEMRIGFCKDVRFEAKFYALKNEDILMLWMIQPNGWHWVDDDGFGMTNDKSIVLYSVLNNKYEFIKPFTLFSIEKTQYCYDYDYE